MGQYNYNELLKKAEKELPETITSSERFKVENIRGHIEGNKTILSNFKKIIKDIHRNPEHVLKYLLKELATPGRFNGDRLILGAKVPASRINKKIKKYVGEYVLCPECGKPDTQLTKKDGITHIKCSACGAERPIKNI
jgi:translation initiation factor 2 subunit 2